jgi:hypothetical protein
MRMFITLKLLLRIVLLPPAGPLLLAATHLRRHRA